VQWAGDLPRVLYLYRHHDLQPRLQRHDAGNADLCGSSDLHRHDDLHRLLYMSGHGDLPWLRDLRWHLDLSRFPDLR